jgi:hypothetical protein
MKDLLRRYCPMSKIIHLFSIKLDFCELGYLFSLLFGRAFGLLPETLGAGFWRHHHLFTHLEHHASPTGKPTFSSSFFLQSLAHLNFISGLAMIIVSRTTHGTSLSTIGTYTLILAQLDGMVTMLTYVNCICPVSTAFVCGIS